MLRIKRTKTTGEGEKRVTLTHYATAVSPRGTVEGWDRDPAKAVAITEAVAKRVREYHAGRKNTGEFEFETVDATAAQLASAVAADDAVGAAEFAKLQAVYRSLRAESIDQEKRLDELLEERAKLRDQLQGAAAREQKAEDALAAKGEECGRQAARIADLEAELAGLKAAMADAKPQQLQQGNKPAKK